MPDFPDDDALIKQVKRCVAELCKRASLHDKVEKYYEGKSPMPTAITEARLTRAYRYLMPMSDAPWGSLIVDSPADRLEVTGIKSDDKAVDDKVWGAWQDNGMDAESKLAHSAALLDGRAFALVEPDGAGNVEITLDDATQMIVEYRPGSRRHRAAAVRCWVEDDGTPYATLYRPDGIFKFVGSKDQSPSEADWERREVDDEDWPLPNSTAGRVPVAEIAVNRRLKPGTYGFARGEYQHCRGLIDRINLLTFLGLVVAFWQGFPLRGVIGEKITRRVLVDDDGEPLLEDDGVTEKSEVDPPFDAHADGVFQLENPEAKLAEFKAADRKNLSVFAELDQLAVITKTPRHYFPLEQGMSNLSADAIRASEGALHAKVASHKGSIGEGWEEVLRLCGLAMEDPVELSPRAALQWRDHEFRSLAERGDAASKLKDVLPWQAVAEVALNASPEQIAQWAAERAADPVGILATAALSGNS